MAGTGETKWPSNCLFHYSDRVSVEAIAEDGCFRVGTGAQFGFGLYATDLQWILLATGLRMPSGRWDIIPWS